MPQPFMAVKRIGKRVTFTPGVIAVEVRRVLEAEGRAVVKSYNQTVTHWKGERPQFGIISRQVAPSRTRDVEIVVGMRGGPEKGQDKWRWLDEGTRERWAVMNPNFRRKTQPGTTKTRAGSPPFEPDLRGRKAMKTPRPGIKPRGWSGIIVNRHTPIIKRAIRRAVSRGIAMSMQEKP